MDDLIAPEQALTRPDRPLLYLGLKWNPTQTLIGCAAFVSAATWGVGWFLVGVADNALMSLHGLGGALPWLLIPWLLCGVGGWYAVRLYQDRSEPVARQRWGRGWRRLRDGATYGPRRGDGGHAIRVEERVWTVPLAGWRVFVPVPVREPGRVERVWPRATVDERGVARLDTDGRYRAYLDVTPIILSSKGAARRREARAKLADVLADTAPGRCAQMWVDNTPTDGRAVLAELDRREDRAGAWHDAVRAGRRRQIDHDLTRTYAADARYLLVVEADDADAALDRQREVARLLAEAGPRATPLEQAQVLDLLEAPRAIDPSPSGGADDGAIVCVGRDGRAVWRATLYARGLPGHARFDDLLALPLLPVRSTLSVTVRGRDPRAMERWLEGQAQRMRSSDMNKRRAAARAAARDGLVVIDQNFGSVALQSDARETERVYEEVRAGAVSVVDMGLTLTLEAPDRAALERALHTARIYLRKTRLTMERGVHAQGPLLAASRPFCLPPFWPLRTTTRTVAGVFPFVKETPGPVRLLPAAPPLTLLGRTERGGQLAFFGWLAATDALAVLGNQGMGKSVILALLMDAALRRGEWVTVLDPVGSFNDLCAALGADGHIVDILAPGVAVNLLALLGAGKGDRALEALDILAHILGGGDRSYTLAGAGVEHILEAGVRALYARADRRRALGLDGTPRLRYLAAWLRREERRLRLAGIPDEAAQCRALYRRLQPYYGAGSFASLLDRRTTVDLTVPYLGLNTSRFLAQRGPVAALAFSLATTVADWRTAEGTRRGVPVTTVLDEGYSVLTLALDWFAGNSARRIRHNRTKLVIATHMLEDLADDEQARKALTAFNLYLIVCTESDRAVLVDKLKLPDQLAERASALRRTDHYTEAFYLVKRPDAEPDFAVVQIRPPRELLYLVGSYGAEKDERAEAGAHGRGGLIGAATRAARRERQKGAAR